MSFPKRITGHCTVESEWYGDRNGIDNYEHICQNEETDLYGILGSNYAKHIC